MDSYINIDLSIFIKRWKIIVIIALIFAIMFYAYTTFVSKPSYWYSRSYIITNSVSYSNDDQSRQTSINELNASQSLATTYSELIKRDEMISLLSDYIKNETGTQFSYRALSSFISVDIGSTEIVSIRVTTGDKELSHLISSAIDTYLIPLAMEVYGFAEFKAIPKLLEGENSPSPIKAGVMGVGVGCVLAAIFIVLVYIFNNKISDEDEFAKLCKVPVLGTIPDPAVNTRGGRVNEK